MQKPKQKLGETAALLQRVVNFYAHTLHKDRAGLNYLKRLKLDDPALLGAFHVGYCNGTLRQALPRSGAVIEELRALGVLNREGEEQLVDCVTVPVFDPAGNVCGMYGRQITSREPSQRSLSGSHRGVWNGACTKTNPSLLVVGTVWDGLSLWQAGFKNVISLDATNGWTVDHEQLFKDNNIAELTLCLGNDEAGRAVTDRLTHEVLPVLVKTVQVIVWPTGVKDANEFFQGHGPQDFGALLQALQPPIPSASHPIAADGSEQVTMTPDGFTVVYGARRYELRAIEKPGASRLKATIRAVGEQGRFVIDTVDFYLLRSRRGFLSEAARLFREPVAVIEGDVNRLIEQLEQYITDRRTGLASPVALVSATDKAEALRFGRHPDLVGQIQRDMERLGLMGETVNKLIGYLVMTSRKLPDPLALLILSGSGAGKSHLQDTVLALCPAEDLIKLTSLTDRALFYKGADSLRHKVLAVEELAGAAGADYAIRNLISAKKLVIESTMKNPLTGKLETQVNTVQGPTAVFQTTTNPRMDAETRSRFILVSVDESAAQTRAILQAQRQRHTLEGWRQRFGREAILRRHHAWQRLLRPLRVVNPFEPLLSYPDEQLVVRRDHPKYLHLILAVTFLHQLQRPIQRDEVIGDEYIETTLADIAIANDLAHSLFGHSLEELTGPGRELLRLIVDYVATKAGQGAALPVSFNRRELREAFHWGDTRLRTHLAELVGMEYLVPLCGRFGQTYQYRLLGVPREETGRFLAGLKSVEQLRREANLAGLLTGLAPASPVGQREVPDAILPNQDGSSLPSPGNLAPVAGGQIPEVVRDGGNMAGILKTTGGVA